MCTYVTVTRHCHAKHPLAHKINSPTTLSCHHLPPIWPLEQTRWVRGRVAHSSLRIAEVLVVTAVSWGRFGQTEGAYRPGRRWPSPKRGEFCRTRVRLSHLGLQMKLRGRSPLTVCPLLFVLNNCVLATQRDNWAAAIAYLWIYSYNCECHAQTGTSLQFNGTQ